MDHWTAMFVVPRLYFPLSFLTAVTFIGVLNSFTWGKKKKGKETKQSKYSNLAAKVHLFRQWF